MNRRIKAASVGCKMFSSAGGDNESESERSPLLPPIHPGNRDKRTLGTVSQASQDTVGFKGQMR